MSSGPGKRPSVGERYQVLLQIGRKLTGTLEQKELYQAIYHETARVLDASGFFISLYDEARDLARMVFCAEAGEERDHDIAYRGSDSEVIRDRTASRIDDNAASESLLVLGDRDTDVTRSAISAPLLFKGRVIGAISAQSYEADRYTDEDLGLLQAIADIAAVAIENARYVFELEKKRKEAERIEEIGRALVSSLDAPFVLRRVAESAVELLDADGSSVWLVSPGEELVIRVEASSGDVRLPEGSEWPLQFSSEIAGPLIHERRTISVPDIAASNLIPENLRPHLAGGSGIASPLMIEGRVVGVLTSGKRTVRGFSDEDIAVQERLAAQASVALENARLHESVQNLSLTDPLTGIPNRRHLQIHLTKEIAAARRGRELCLVLFDLDNFKGFNDRAGHVAGDEALRAFAGILLGETRTMNLAARYGGDEFVTVVSDTEEEGVRYHAARIRQRVAADPMLSGEEITVSHGFARFDPETMSTIEDLIRAADEDMYRSKNGTSPDSAGTGHLNLQASPPSEGGPSPEAS